MQHMGMCAEKCAKDYNINREAQDNFAIRSYQSTAASVTSGLFKEEIVGVDVRIQAGVA